MAKFDSVRGEFGTHTMYKFRLSLPNGETRTANIAIAPLFTREMTVVGRILLVDDITDRTQLEEQLTQAEKLSSIGLAGGGRGARGEHAVGGDLELYADAGEADERG